MPKYVALLRGIMPTNPNMRGAKLKSAVEELGHRNVSTLITSGNVLFEAKSTDTAKLEKTIQKAWPQKLGFDSMTIVKSQKQLLSFVDINPFKDLQHGKQTYLLVTFLKEPLEIDFKFPYTPEGKDFTLLGADEQTIFSSIDLNHSGSPDLMAWLEKQYGKDITSRTWLTINRILQKMN